MQNIPESQEICKRNAFKKLNNGIKAKNYKKDKKVINVIPEKKVRQNNRIYGTDAFLFYSSFFFTGYFSTERGCPRVMKFCMGF